MLLRLPDAVAFEKSNRAVSHEATVFVASFIANPYNDADEPPDFLVVPANGEKSVPLIMGQSGLMLLRYLKVIAYADETVNAVTKKVNCQNFHEAKLEPIDTVRSWMEYLKLDMFVSSHVGQPYFPRVKVQGGDVDNIVMPLSLQGFKAGQGMVKLNYLIPVNGTIMLRFTNTHPTKPISINGAFIGVKLRFN